MSTLMLSSMQWWSGSDWIIRGVFVVLAAASVISWSIIFYKFGQYVRVHHREGRLHRSLADIDTGLEEMAGRISGNLPTSALLLVALARAGGEGAGRHALEADLAQVSREWRIRLESGLTLLASIGSSAPFIGLFGTVWGIMHALQGLAGQTALSMDLVAGPVAEALVATAVGLFAAIPAVMGYNMLVRRLRRLMVAVEGNALRIINRLSQPPSRQGTAVAVQATPLEKKAT